MRGNVREDFKQQLTNEYWNTARPHGAEWHHQGEANHSFYGFGLPDPTISENVRRARRFAAMFIGEDPSAPNWDAKHKIIRSPMHGSTGPYLKTNVEEVAWWLIGGMPPTSGPRYGRRASLNPWIDDLSLTWYEDPALAAKIVKLFEDVVLNGDIANNLAATGLVTNVYLYTGDDKYKQWVLDYTEAWIDRAKKNGGVIPDNVGPTGKPGEQRKGEWWGALYGWQSRGFKQIAHGMTIAVECAQLLTGDSGYLEFLRSHINLLLEHSMKGEDGQLLTPMKYGKIPAADQVAAQHAVQQGRPKEAPGWFEHAPIVVQEAVALYHASMSRQDYELIARIRSGDVRRKWDGVKSEGEKNAGDSEMWRFQYYDGKLPNWPERLMEAELASLNRVYHSMVNDHRDVETIIRENRFALQSQCVATKGLIQMTMGCPQPVYNGGLVQATVRYFDADRARPGLPQDVAALVDELSGDRVGVQLVNTSRSETRRLIVQAGAYGEHAFTEGGLGSLTETSTQHSAPRTLRQ